jgi:hypothetical protein
MRRDGSGRLVQLQRRSPQTTTNHVLATSKHGFGDIGLEASIQFFIPTK